METIDSLALTRRSVHVQGLEISYLEAGTGDPVLFLHGWPTHSLLWREILPTVAASGRRAIAIDLPGFGQSSKPIASYSFPFFERTLSGFLDALEISRLGLVVHDLGGPIGVYWMAQNPERVSELALLNTLLFPEMSWAVKAFVAATYLPVVRWWLSSRQGLRWALRFGVTDKARIDRNVARIYQEPFRDRPARRALLAAGHGLHPGGFETIAAAIPTFEVPLRIVFGVRDRILPDVQRTMDRVAGLQPNTVVTALPDAGHFLQEDQPHEVARLLADFLGR